MIDNNPLIDMKFFVPFEISRRVLYHAQQLDYLHRVSKRFDAKEHMDTHDGLAEILGRCIAYTTDLGPQADKPGNVVFTDTDFERTWDVRFPIQIPVISDYTRNRKIRLTPTLARVYGKTEINETERISFLHKVTLDKRTVDTIDGLTARYPHKLANDKFMTEAFAFYELLWWHAKQEHYLCVKVNGFLQNNNKLSLLNYQ